MKWVVDTNNFRGTAKTIITNNGTCPYYGKTEAEYILEGYSILSDEEFDLLLENWENTLTGNWKEITEEIYEDMLGVLPPMGWYNGGFFISERYTGNISSFYQELDGKYYTSLQRINTPRKTIIDSLKNFTANR